ncbi:hypothetical protein [Ciceribacter sichuanensis]|nr:hypothetical protein [Ciceribacter sp. S153]
MHRKRLCRDPGALIALHSIILHTGNTARRPLVDLNEIPHVDASKKTRMALLIEGGKIAGRRYPFCLFGKALLIAS